MWPAIKLPSAPRCRPRWRFSSNIVTFSSTPEHRLRLLVGEYLAPVLRILAFMRLDVIPDLFDRLRARQRLAADTAASSGEGFSGFWRPFAGLTSVAAFLAVAAIGSSQLAGQGIQTRIGRFVRMIMRRADFAPWLPRPRRHPAAPARAAAADRVRRSRWKTPRLRWWHEQARRGPGAAARPAPPFLLRQPAPERRPSPSRQDAPAAN